MRNKLMSIIGIILLAAYVSAEVDHYYEIELKYNQGDISYETIKVKPIATINELDNIARGYMAEIRSFDNEILNFALFNIPLTIIYDRFDDEGNAVGGGLIELNESEITIRIPYYENAKEINIYDSNITRKLTIDVSPYSKSIPAELKSEQEIKQLREEIIKEKETIKGKNFNKILVYVFCIFLIILSLIIYLIKRRK